MTNDELNELEDISNEVKELREKFDSYWNTIKEILSSLQIKELSKDLPDDQFLIIPGRHKIVSRPINFCNIIIKIGFQNNEIRIFDANDRPFFYPIAGNEDGQGESFWKEFFRDMLETESDMADFKNFYDQLYMLHLTKKGSGVQTFK